MRPRRSGSVLLSTGLHAALCCALVFPPMLRMPELAAEPPDNLPKFVDLFTKPQRDETPVKLPEKAVTPRGTTTGRARGTTTSPKRYVAPPPGGVIPDFVQVASSEDSCPDCEITFEPPAPPGPPGPRRGDPTSPIVITPDVTPPVPISTPAPVYPDPVRMAHIEGTVILEAVIDRDGFVRDVRVMRTVNPLLDRSASTAVLSWRYRPALVDDRPVAVYLTVTINFRLTR